MIPKKWVLVTGAPRSGTTFVGSVLSFPREVDYIHEPFNPECGMRGIKTRYLYTRGGAESGAEVDFWISRLLAYRFTLQTAQYPGNTLLRGWVKRVVGGRGVNYFRLARVNPFSEYALVKDPFACLLPEYLSRAHGIKTLALIRHPVAFVAGVRRMKWDPNKGLHAIAAKPELIEDYFAGEEDLLKPGANMVQSAARLWRALNKVILRQATENSSIKVVTLERLSASPIEQFELIYAWAGLPWRDSYRRRILRMTSSENPVEAASMEQDFKRNSADLLAHRLRQMSPEDTQVVWEITQEVAATLYQRPISTSDFGV